jgi:hypothetical protein
MHEKIVAGAKRQQFSQNTKYPQEQKDRKRTNRRQLGNSHNGTRLATF